jgi:sugar phosphate isomerase/epimerase
MGYSITALYNSRYSTVIPTPQISYLHVDFEAAMFRYAICNELFHDRSLEQGVREAAALGYTGLEIAPFTLAPPDAPYANKISPEMRRSVRRNADDAGVEIIGLHWLLAKTTGFHLTTRDSEVRVRTANYLGELTQLCADLGGSLMVLGSPLQRNFSGDMTHDEALENAADVLKRLAPALERHQIVVAVEPLGPGEGNFLNHASQARTLIEQVGSPWVRLHLDVKAMSSEGKPIPDVIRENRDLLAHFHANDPNLLGPGMGEVRFEPIFQALQDISYPGWVSVEVFDYKPGVEKILQESMQTMKHAELACSP